MTPVRGRILLVVLALASAALGWTLGSAPARRDLQVPQGVPAGSAERRDPPASIRTPAQLATAVSSLSRLLELEVEERQRLAGELEALRRRVAELEQRPALTDAREAAAPAGGGRSDPEPGVSVESFVEAGFAPSEAEYLKQRYDEARMARLYLRDRAIREGWYRTERYFDSLSELPDELSQLREQMDEATLDRYLYATSRPNRVAVVSVLGSSAAEQAGLQPGDIIYRYDGARMFDRRRLIAATREGRAGEAIPLDILRDGRRITVYVPRGPLGVSMSSASSKP